MALTAHLYRRMMRKGRVIALVCLSSIPALAYWLTAFDADPAELGVIYNDIVPTSGFSFAIAALILTVATLREERDAGTLPYLYMRPIARSSIAASSIAAGIAAAGSLAVAGWAASALAVAAVGADISIAIPGLSLFLAGAIGYAAVFVPLGYLVPRSTLVGLGYLIIGEMIVGSAIAGIGQLSIWRISVSILADLVPQMGPEAMELLGEVSVGVATGVVKLGAILLVGMVTLTWALRRRDAL